LLDRYLLDLRWEIEGLVNKLTEVPQDVAMQFAKDNLLAVNGVIKACESLAELLNRWRKP
jgi:hypothetical protein